MKKIFLIATACFVTIIVGLLIATNFIFVTEKISDKAPSTISVYKKSLAVLNGKTYEEKDDNYKLIYEEIEKIGNVSIFDRLIYSAGLNNQLEQSNNDEYTKSISEVRKNNYCVEYIFDKRQDKIVYLNGNTKVITYDKLLYVLPTASGVNNIIIYYAESSNGYEKFNPIIMNGKTENIINLINGL